MTWQTFSGSEAEWDNLAISLASTSPYQTSAWASFKRSAGWSSVRLLTTDGRCAVQVLIKHFMFVSIVWAPGGPIGEVTEAGLIDLAAAIETESPSLVQYVRVSDFRPSLPALHKQYELAGWHRPRATLSAAQTLTCELNRNTLGSNYSKNWSRNLRRGEDRGITASAWLPADGTEIAHLHQSVVTTKGLETNDWRTRPAEVARLLECFANQLVLVKATDAAGTLLALRGAVVIGGFGFDFLAATSVDGRKNYASNVALHHLLDVLTTRGVTAYDFGGVDYHANKGVYDFKHGAGGTEHSYVGEFEMVRPRILRSFISTMVASRLPK